MLDVGEMHLRPDICALLVAALACDAQDEKTRAPAAESTAAAETREATDSEGTNTPETREAPPAEPPATVPDLELVAASMGSTPQTRGPVRVYLARAAGQDDWPLLCSEVSGEAADQAAAATDGTLLRITGRATEFEETEYRRLPVERHCRIEAVLERHSGYSVHLPAGLGPLRGGMTHEQIATALSVSPEEIPADTDEQVFVVAGWGLVMDHDYLQFFATDVSRLPRLVASGYGPGRPYRVDLARHTCQQPGWTGEMWRRYGWVENEATATRIAFASAGVKWSWYASYVCGSARRLTADGNGD